MMPSAMTPTDVLREEHRVILRALDLARGGAPLAWRAARSLPEGWWPEIIAWLRGFADKNHHAKEETSLFPAMVKAGVPVGWAARSASCSRSTSAAARWSAPWRRASPPRAAAKAREYVALLREHIDKENGVLFPLADAVLDEAAQRALQREFEAVEAEQGRDASIAHAEAAVERLAAALAA